MVLTNRGWIAASDAPRGSPRRRARRPATSSGMERRVPMGEAEAGAGLNSVKADLEAWRGRGRGKGRSFLLLWASNASLPL
jgi:hypothetical protein